MGKEFLPLIDRNQIITAAFLNMHVAWETFLESALAEFMIGTPTISGRAPVRFVSPRTVDDAQKILIGANRYFDFANPDNVRKIVKIYFENGYPFEPHLSSIASDLADLRTMRNGAAHISTTTQTAINSLAQRLTVRASPGIELWDLLTTPIPDGQTVFERYKNALLLASELIAQG
ncbi:MAG: hypothetical protein ACOYMG_18740 [Candidatus Methylumidiphilus sp.]